MFARLVVTLAVSSWGAATVAQAPGLRIFQAVGNNDSKLVDVQGNIVLDPTTNRCGPTAPLWIFTEPGFLSRFVSSAERLPNGDTLICSGLQQRLFEVTSAGQTVCSYTNPSPALIFQSHYVDRSLWADTDALSVSGGQVGFDHLTGSIHVGDIYVLPGSVSGTSPGTLVGGVTLPLNFDYLTNATATQWSSGVFVNTIGPLDADGGGSSSAILVPPGFIPPALAGVQMNFAHLIFDSSLLALRASKRNYRYHRPLTRPLARTRRAPCRRARPRVWNRATSPTLVTPCSLSSSGQSTQP